eukprot:284816014_5
MMLGSSRYLLSPVIMCDVWPCSYSRSGLQSSFSFLSRGFGRVGFLQLEEVFDCADELLWVFKGSAGGVVGECLLVEDFNSFLYYIEWAEVSIKQPTSSIYPTQTFRRIVWTTRLAVECRMHGNPCPMLHSTTAMSLTAPVVYLSTSKTGLFKVCTSDVDSDIALHAPNCRPSAVHLWV